MSILTIQNLSKEYFSGKKSKMVLKDIHLNVEEGELISIIGPSGCGKSTLLRIIGGLETEYRGLVRVNGADIHGPGRDRGFIFQDHRLLPWLTVKENIRFSLPQDTIQADEKIIAALSLVSLSQAVDAYPGQLSGGMAQRVAVARALVNQPKLLLLDEPFGALDAMTKIKLQDELLRLWRKEHITMILVTHDIDEAVYLGNRIVVLDANPGQLRDIYTIDHAEPRSRTSPDFHRQIGRAHV